MSTAFPSLRRRAVACISALALLGPAHAQNVQDAPPRNALPALGDTAGDDLAVGTERRLGDQIMREIRRDPEYLDDPLLLEYLQSVWQPLLAAARARGEIAAEVDQRYAWEPFLVRDRTVNAFALPGGYVGVHLGLIALTATRDELASVLAHELSHVTQRHIARGVGNARRASIVGLAAMILGALAAAKSSRGDGASAIMSGGQAAAIQSQLNFSREMEREADRVGFAILTQAGYAPGGMAAMFDKLEQASRLNDSGSFPYLRSHPLTVERIGEARARLGAAPAVAPAPSAPLEHAVAQARARVLMETRQDALSRRQAQDAELAEAGAGGRPTGAADRLGAAYASALASTLLRDWSRADAALAQAKAIAAASPRAEPRALRAVALLDVETQLARRDPARARAAFAPLAGDRSRPALLMRAQLALAAPPSSGDDDARRSVDELQTWIATHPRDALAWGAIGPLYDRLGQTLRARRADAEAALAVGDLNGAAERLRGAQRSAKGGDPADFIEASVIDARLRAVEAERRGAEADRRALGLPPG